MNFTPNSIIAYLYGETNLSESLSIEHAMDADPLLSAEYRELASAKKEFPKVMFNAPSSTLQAILRYSKKTRMEQQV
jgi:hypothetical protein